MLRMSPFDIKLQLLLLKQRSCETDILKHVWPEKISEKNTLNATTQQLRIPPESTPALGLPDEFCKNTGHFIDSDRSRLQLHAPI